MSRERMNHTANKIVHHSNSIHEYFFFLTRLLNLELEFQKKDVASYFV